MSQYASQTQVSVERSQAEIRKILKRYGADAVAVIEADAGAAVEFSANQRRIRFVIEMPDPQDRQFTRTPTGRTRSVTEAGKAHEQAVKQRWRALGLVIKAKLEAVESNIVSFESEFLAHTVLPSGKTVADEVAPQIEAAYSGGEVTPLQIER